MPCRRSQRAKKTVNSDIPPNISSSMSENGGFGLEISRIKTQLQSITEFLTSNFSVPKNTLVASTNMDTVKKLDGTTIDTGAVGSASYADAASGKNRSPKETPSTIDAVLKAVHTDFIDKQQLMRNVIVRGLKPSTSPSISDSDLFQQFCFDHLGISLHPIRCRRLGKRTEEKIQPLLVVLPSVETVQSILSIAKRLRESSDVYIQSSVYISADLTKAEAAAEFERRDAHRRRKKIEHQNTAASVNSHPNTTSVADIQSGNMQSGNIQSGNMQSGNIQSGNIQSGNMQSGNIQSGNIQSGNMQSGNMQSGNISTSFVFTKISSSSSNDSGIQPIDITDTHNPNNNG